MPNGFPILRPENSCWGLCSLTELLAVRHGVSLPRCYAPEGVIPLSPSRFCRRSDLECGA
ncbi:hypothetical protein GCM10010149_10000 [Nonomuraea roseoviolacea subsp. roseoviolacea]